MLIKVDRQVPRKPRLLGGVKGHNINGISLAHILLATACPGSPALWAGSFNWNKWGEGEKEGKFNLPFL